MPSPPAVALAKINGAVHRPHAFLQQPMPGHIKKTIRCFLVIDTVKKPNTAHRKFVSFGLISFIDEGGNPAQRAISVSECSLPWVKVSRIAAVLLVTDRPDSVAFPAIPT
jgi:hypothetical protein